MFRDSEGLWFRGFSFIGFIRFKQGLWLEGLMVWLVSSSLGDSRLRV